MSLRSVLLRRFYWTKDFFNGKPVGIFYKELKKCSKNKEFARNLKQERLNALLNYATSNCEFYKGYKGKDLSSFPVVNKRILIENHDKIIVPEDINPYQPSGSKYHIQKTSGSTGTPFAIEQDVRKRNRRVAELKYFGEIVGFKSHESLIHLRIWTKWQSKSKKQIFWENIVPFDISNLNEEHLSELTKVIIENKAVCLRGYASSFDLYAKYLETHPARFPKLKIAIAGSEALFDSTRDLVRKNMKCEIISQYANEENGILAQEIPGSTDHHFYINNDGYVFEVLKFDSDEPAEYGELGRIVLTDLFNYAFPVIRYDNGDTCILEKDASSGEIYISKLFGRKLDMVFNTDSEPVFPMTLARILKNFDGIKQWQFIQTDKTKYTLKLCIDSIFAENNSEDTVLRNLTEIFGEASNIHVEYVDDIPVLQSGKRKSVVNLFNQN